MIVPVRKDLGGDLGLAFCWNPSQHHSNVWRLDHYNPQKEDHMIATPLAIGSRL
uniref:Uncharacterized protein n=1 Tax=Solanum lycopersicum TaxID=4081 RepID=A0A3Q7FGZ6_SOLLC